MVAVRTTSSALEVPIVSSGPCGVDLTHVHLAHLEFLVTHANALFDANVAKTAVMCCCLPFALTVAVESFHAIGVRPRPRLRLWSCFCLCLSMSVVNVCVECLTGCCLCHCLSTSVSLFLLVSVYECCQWLC